MDLVRQNVSLDCVKCPKAGRCDEIAVILQDEELERFVQEHGGD